MLIRFFKNNSPSAFIILPLFALFFWVPGFFAAHDAFDFGMPFYTAVIKWFSGSGGIASFVAYVLVIAQAFLLNYIVNENEVLSKPSFLPALLYIVFMSSDTAQLTLYPLLFANLFILLAIHKLVSSYRKDTAFSNSFDAAFLLSVASLFYFPCVVFFPVLYVGFILFRPFNWREWVIALIGIVVPFTFVFTYFFWNDMLGSLWSIQLFYPNPQRSKLATSDGFYVMLSVCLLMVSLAFGKLFTGLSDASQKNKKGILLLLWLTGLALLSVFLSPEITLRNFSVLAIPAAVFCSNYFLKMKRTQLGEVLFFMLMIALFINHLLSYK
ncbi:MAG: DUF6427 family protein [Bacteroidia bacterium]|jgi:hypothetical protein